MNDVKSDVWGYSRIWAWTMVKSQTEDGDRDYVHHGIWLMTLQQVGNSCWIPITMTLRETDE
jgi:hypothetical protein